MGAGIEDGVVLKALQYGVVPPVANLREPDEQLGDLTLSRGERKPFEYAIRLAAGFGSQLAITVHQRVAVGDRRVADQAARIAWLRQVTGFAHVEERIEHRTLRAYESAVDKPYDLRPAVSFDGTPGQTPVASAPPEPTPAPAPPAKAAPAPAAPRAGAPSFERVLADLVAVVAAKTGYEPGEIEPDFELEADLGVDTVKQAEILSDLTEKYGLERDETFRIADYPTLTALAGYLMGRAGGAGSRTVPGTQIPAAERVVAADAARVEAPAARIEPAPPKAPAPTPPAPAPVAAGGSDGSLRDLIEVVAAKTGYSPDELEPDFELEADLGIDTVKQAEILSELTSRYGLERDEAFRLSDHPTIEALAAYLAARRGGATPSEARSVDESTEDTEDSPTTSAPTLVPAPTLAPPEREVAPAVAPPQLVSLDPLPSSGDHAATLRELMEVVAEKTGYELSDLEPTFELEADLGVDTVKQAEILSALQERYGLGRDESFRPADHPTLEALARYLDARRSGGGAPAEEPVEKQATPVTDEQDDDRLRPMQFVAEEFDLGAGLTTAEKIRVNHVPLPDSFRLRRVALAPKPRAGAPAALEGRRVQVLGSGPVASAVRDELAGRGAEVALRDADGPFDAVIDAGDDVIAAFGLARALDKDRPGRWMTLTRLGGVSPGAPVDRAFVDGSRAGFTKSLGREWAGTSITVLDVHPDVEPIEVAKVVCDEYGAAEREVFLDAAGGRSVVRLVEEEPPAPAPLTTHPVVMLTGGGRGITARIAVDLARTGASALALVGRSEVATTPLDEKLAKEQIRAQLQLAGERVTPARVEAALSGLRRSEEARRNLEELRALGVKVLYVKADLADADEARAAVERVTSELGPVEVLVHGAGVEESRQLQDKDEAAFHRVFDGKAVGGRALIEAVGPDAYVVCMGSVAGRFGNPGQVDYAAANDALARMCQSRPNSLHVDWTAWDDVGMAVRGGMRSLLTERGVDLLPADAGASLLTSLVANRVAGEIVVAGDLGDFEERPAQEAPSHALLDQLEVAEGHARGTRALTRANAPWLADHAIDGVPVLPGVVGLEVMAATAAALFPGLTYRGARDVRFDAPIKVHRDEPTSIVCEATAIGDGEAHVRLFSTRRLRTGRQQQLDHFSALVEFGEPDSTDGLPSVFLPDETVDQAAIYRRFFHGPVFQVLTSIFGVSADGLVGEAKVDDRPIGGALLTSPLVLEAAFQAAGLHRMMVAHTMGLPQSIDEVRLLQRPEPGTPLSVTAQLDGELYHVDIDGVSGPILRLRGFAMVDKGPVPPADRFEEPEGGRPECFPTYAEAPLAGGGRVAEARASEDPNPWLTAEELADLRSRGTERRIRDRVAGRIAAKRALAALTGLDPLTIRVQTAESGEPLAEVPGRPDVRVSISHRDGRAIAVAVERGRIGVDLEKIEDRPERFVRDWFSAEERALLPSPELVTVGWAIKEAVLKWLGTGMRNTPNDIRIVAVCPPADPKDGGTAEVFLVGDSAARYVALGADPLQVRWAVVGADEVVVTVRSAA
jgi:NAD(P)-dependent dehydrogenase (short-subunit alcohol dehydrogenase family)/acyl carrier protein/phosphopantetheinyl transferase